MSLNNFTIRKLARVYIQRIINTWIHECIVLVYTEGKICHYVNNSITNIELKPVTRKFHYTSKCES